MSTLTVGHENPTPIRLQDEDRGTGRPVALIRGFTLSGRSWKKHTRINVPTLIMLGNADRILAVAATGRRVRGAIAGAHYAEADGARHGMLWTHANEVSRELLAFIGQQRPIATEPTAESR